VPQATGCRILAFSVDTAIEEHGPHLPLATDTIQSYGVLTALARSNSDVRLARPLDYGQLTWGLPFGFSIDLTADLLARYVTGYANALVRWRQPQALYVVDVHGSITHRNAIVQGLKNSTAEHWRFRWLHEPLAEFASAKGDQHAGGVETALVEHFAPQMIDCHWWPGRKNDIVAGQMTLETAVSLSADLSAFTQHVRTHECNGIIGDVNNYQQLETETLFDRMLKVAVDDIQQLTAGHSEHNAGANLW
jgi:creatinine amidohydrolase/Fe(II)-dependent formamide hydrolase-like protein